MKLSEIMIRGYMTTKQAGEFLGVNDSRVRQFLLSNRLKGVKIGKTWLVMESSLKRFAKSRDRDRRQKKEI